MEQEVQDMFDKIIHSIESIQNDIRTIKKDLRDTPNYDDFKDVRKDVRDIERQLSNTQFKI